MSASEPKIPGALNFRDVAPFAGDHGRLKAGWLYRSGTMEGLGNRAANVLRERAIATVIDLRSDNEIARYPVPLDADSGIRFVAAHHRIHLGDLSTVVRDRSSTPCDIRSAMLRVYREIPAGFAPVLKLALASVVAAEGPVVINCTAGKDRTGAAVALILSSLGVHRDDIFADYLESRHAGPDLMALLKGRRGGIDYSTMAEALLVPLHAADEAYLAALFEVIDAAHGGPVRYVREVLGIDPAALIARLAE